MIACKKDHENTLNITLIDLDGNSYKTIQIGTQIWMAENLKTTLYADGTKIPLIEQSPDWEALGYRDKAMSYYNNSIQHKATYGALYTWAAAMNGYEGSAVMVQGVCPDGWHLPGDGEWKELEIYLGMNPSEADRFNFRGTNEGSQLAAYASLWNHDPMLNDNETLVNNADFGKSGFEAIPAGHRSPNGLFNQMGEIAVFWSSSESGDSYGLTRLLHSYNTRVHRFTDSKKEGYSVRCLKN